MVYNDTFMNNVTSIVGLADGLQASTGYDYLFGYLILLSVFLIYVAIASPKFDWLEVMSTGSFISLITAILLYAIGWLPVSMISLPMVLLAISLVWHYMSG